MPARRYRPITLLEWLPDQSPQVADGTWRDITGYCQVTNISMGRQVELERFSSGTAQFQLRDTTRRFDPEWTSGEWFGQLTPGKQIRLTARAYDLFASGNASTSQGFYTPDSAQNSITGDIDVRARIAPDSWTAYGAILSKNGGTATNGWVFYVENATGKLTFRRWLPADTIATSTVAVTGVFAAWVRATCSAATGEVNFYTASGASVPEHPDSWTQLGTTVASTAGNIIDAGGLRVGYGDSVGIPLVGRIYEAQVRNGIDGPIVAKFSATDLAASGAVAGQTFVGSFCGEPWTVGNFLGNTYADRFCYFDGTGATTHSSNNASTPHNSLLNLPAGTDLDIRVWLFSDWAQNDVTSTLISKWSSGHRTWVLRTASWNRSVIEFIWYDSGINIRSVSFSGLMSNFAAGNWVRLTVDVDNGAGGHVVTIYNSPDGGTTWTPLATGNAGAFTTSFNNDGTARLRVGDDGDLTGTQSWTGILYYAQVHQGIGGTIAASFDSNRASAAVDDGTGTWTDAQGNTWTLEGKILPCGSAAWPVWRGYVRDWGEAQIPDKDNLYRTTVTAHDALTQFEYMGLPTSWLEAAVAQDRPTHWWRLDESAGATIAKDNGYASVLYDAYYQNSPTLDDATAVPYDGGRNGTTFNGVNQYVSIGASASEATTNYTVEVWFTTTSLPSAGQANICRFGLDSAGNAMVEIAVTNYLGAGVARAWATIGNSNYLGPAVAINDGAPHQIVAVRNGTTGTLYLDGVSVSTAACASTALSTADEASIARPRKDLADQNFFNGTVSNVIFWSGVLDSTQILDHWYAGRYGYGYPYITDTSGPLSAVLDYKGWPTALRNLSTGASEVGAYDLPSTVAELVGRMQDTEAGQTFISPDGKLTHRNRHLFADRRSREPQAVFGDAHGTATLNYLVDGFSMPLDETQIRNPVYAARQDGVTSSATDAALIASTYGERGYNAPVAYDYNDNVMADRAAYYLGRFKQGKTRLRVMRFAAHRNPVLYYPQVLARQIGDRITVKRKPLNTGNETALDFIIEGIRHEITVDTWTTDYIGSQVDTTVGWILGHAIYSVLGTTTIPVY